MNKSYSGVEFRVMVGAPEGSPNFRPNTGWHPLRAELGLEIGKEKWTWVRPNSQAPCRRIGVFAHERRIEVPTDLIQAVLPREGKGLSLWLPHPVAGRLPRRFRLSRRVAEGSEKTGVWTTEDEYSSPSGLYYYFNPAVFEVDIPVDARWGLRAVEQTDGAEGWTEPLVVAINANSSEPSRDTAGQKNFWDAILRKEGVLDLFPRFPTVIDEDPRDQLRVRYYLHAGEQAQKNNLTVERRSALQALVFGLKPRPAPLWFLLLDALGGQFRLTGFLSGRPQWTWHEPASLGFWDRWLARVACDRSGIIYASEDQGVSGIVPPSPFRALRWSEARSPGQGFSTVNAPKGTVRPDQGEFAPATSWQGLLRDLLGLKATEELEAEVVIRFLSGRFLLPRSPVLVQLPEWPLGPTGPVEVEWRRLQSVWRDAVCDRGWLDLVRSSLWPEAWWPQGLLWDGEASAAEPWPARSHAWHHAYHTALHFQPASYRATWQIELPFFMGRASFHPCCVLGPAQAHPPIERFVLR